MYLNMNAKNDNTCQKNTIHTCHILRWEPEPFNEILKLAILVFISSLFLLLTRGDVVSFLLYDNNLLTAQPLLPLHMQTWLFISRETRCKRVTEEAVGAEIE